MDREDAGVHAEPRALVRQGCRRTAPHSWTGCKANETSADAYFNGRYNGAFTYNFVKVIRDTKNTLPRKDVIAKVGAQMKGSFAQNPQLEGNATNRANAVVY